MVRVGLVTLFLFLASSISFAEGKDVLANSEKLCYVPQTAEALESNTFFRKAVAASNRYDNCTVAYIFNKKNSARVYVNGHRLEKDSGSLPISLIGDRNSSNTKIDINIDGYPVRCEVYTCEESTRWEITLRRMGF